MNATVSRELGIASSLIVVARDADTLMILHLAVLAMMSMLAVQHAEMDLLSADDRKMIEDF